MTKVTNTMRQSVAENESVLKNLLYGTSPEAFNAFVAERWTSYATWYSAYRSEEPKKSAKGRVLPAHQGMAVNSSKMVDYVIRSALKEDERQGRELWIEIFSTRYASVISAYTRDRLRVELPPADVPAASVSSTATNKSTTPILSRATNNTTANTRSTITAGRTKRRRNDLENLSVNTQSNRGKRKRVQPKRLDL